MISRLIFIFSLMLSYMASGFFYAAQASEPTRIRIGLAGATPNQSVQGLNISTAQVDEVLRDTVGRFGISDNYTSDLANDVFEEIDQLEANLAAKLRSEVLKVRHVQYVYSVDLDVNPVKVTLSQDGTRIGAMIGSLDAKVSAKGAYGLCGSFRVDLNVTDIALKAEYDVYTGRIVNSQGNYNITRAGIKPYGALGWICKNAVDGFAKIFTGSGIKGNFEKAVENGVKSAIDTVEMQKLFSLRDLLDSTETFIQTVESPGFSYAGYSLSPIPANARRDAASAVRHVNDILGSPSFQGTGLRVTLELADGINYNLISLIVSHAPAKLSSIETEDGQCANTSVFFGDRTEKADIYWRPAQYASWEHVKTTYRAGYVGLGPIQDGSQFIAIGKSNLFGNLYSKPENNNIVTYRRNRNNPARPYIIFCEDSIDDFPTFPAFQ